MKNCRCPVKRVEIRYLDYNNIQDRIRFLEKKVGHKVVYKSRQYVLHYIGDTKFGFRAKLYSPEYGDSFWVDADQVIIAH